MCNLSVTQEKNIQINQGPQGILKHKNKANQDSPRILIEPAPIFKPSKTYKSLPVNEILQYQGIDDYIEPTISPYPTIIKSPTQCYCIDGYNHVEKEKREGSETILCHVLYKAAEVSEIEIALLKMGIRVVSDQGKPYFAELVRHCQKILLMFMQSTINPVIYSHGGRRKGINYSANREENIRTLIAEHLGKSVSTINKYINYGEDLPEDFLNILVQSKEGKRFFEAVASNKRRFIKNLKFEGNDPAEITKKLSKKMADWLEEFHENNGKIKPLPFESVVIKNKCVIDPPKPFIHHGEYDKDHKNETRSTLRQEIHAIVGGLFAFGEEYDHDDNDYSTIVKGEIREIVTRLAKYDALEVS